MNYEIQGNPSSKKGNTFAVKGDKRYKIRTISWLDATFIV